MEVESITHASSHSSLKIQYDPLNLTTIGRLYDAAIKGDTESLERLYAEDPFILDRCMIEKSNRFMQSPLHVAASHGRIEFIKKILSLNSELAKQLDQSTKSTALHLATEKGRLDVVMWLADEMPSMCFVRNRDGRNPIHVAAITSDESKELEHLVLTNPAAAQERTSARETILHLCVKYNKIKNLTFLMAATEELLNAKDGEGNTILHLAVVAKKPEIVKLLGDNKKLQKNAINNDGLTAMDCLLNSDEGTEKEKVIRVELKKARTMKAKYVEKHEREDVIWLDKQRNALMVVAGLIATMAFQYGVDPKWEIEDNATQIDLIHFEDNLNAVMTWNTISFVSSLSVILLLVGGLPCQRFSVIILMLTMWLSISTLLWTYFLALKNPSIRDHLGYDVYDTIYYSFLVWVILVLILLFGHTIRLTIKGVKKLWHLAKHSSWCNKNVRPLAYKYVLHRPPPPLVPSPISFNGGGTSPSFTAITMNNSPSTVSYARP